MDLSNLPAYLDALAAKVATEAATPAVLAMAHTYERAVKRNLSLTSHPRGTFPSPSPPGFFPSLVSGKLRSSVTTAPGMSGGAMASASVAPHTIYAAVQEYGKTIDRRHFRYMHWVANGRDWWKERVIVPSRPYMRPTTRQVVGDGSLSQAAAEAFEIAVWGH